MMEKFINNIRVDKENDDVFFNDETHSYYGIKDMVPYISVTQIIEHFTPKFNEDFFSMYKALERIADGDRFDAIKKALLQHQKYSQKTFDILHVTAEDAEKARTEVLKEWEEKRNASTERGTKIHADLEESFYTPGQHDLKKFGIGGKFDTYEGAKKLEKTGIYPEILLSYKSDDGLLRLSGQSDLVVRSGNTISILD